MLNHITTPLQDDFSLTTMRMVYGLLERQLSDLRASGYSGAIELQQQLPGRHRVVPASTPMDAPIPWVTVHHGEKTVIIIDPSDVTA